MGKRSNFKRNPRDYYRTPLSAVAPLVPHLIRFGWYCEPCAGDGTLITHLSNFGIHHCSAIDIEPQAEQILKMDALDITEKHLNGATGIITNPPWDRKVLHPMIEHFSNLAPTWLLFDSDWSYTKQSRNYTPYLHKEVAVGRVSSIGS